MAVPDSVTIPSWFGPICIIPDLELGQHQPTRKVRGRRRYYRALRREAGTFAVTPSGWYDYMHWHVDWPGLGNLRWWERREHLLVLFTMFRRLLAETGAWPTPHQVWLPIDAFDSSQVAVYLHTANPNADSFPNEFAGTDWGAPIPERLRHHDSQQWESRHYTEFLCIECDGRTHRFQGALPSYTIGRYRSGHLPVVVRLALRSSSQRHPRPTR